MSPTEQEIRNANEAVNKAMRSSEDGVPVQKVNPAGNYSKYSDNPDFANGAGDDPRARGMESSIGLIMNG
jgi:hypothetical protein